MARFKVRKLFRKLLKSAFPNMFWSEEVDIKDTFLLSDKKIKVHIKDYPFQINLYPDSKTLHLYPEPALICGSDGVATNSYILFDPDIFYSDICGYYRLQDDDTITLGGSDPEQRAQFSIFLQTLLRASSASATKMDG